MNGGIINSITRLHLLVISTETPLSGCFLLGESIVIFRKMIKVSIRKDKWMRKYNVVGLCL